MHESHWQTTQIGESLPSFTTAPISRLTLALFAGASGDHNPIHVDTDYARLAGMEDVFAHGMLSMAYLGKLLTNWAPPRTLGRFSVRFVAITRVRERLSCTGRVVEKTGKSGTSQVRVELAAKNDQGEARAVGEATIILPPQVVGKLRY